MVWYYHPCFEQDIVRLFFSHCFHESLWKYSMAHKPSWDECADCKLIEFFFCLFTFCLIHTSEEGFLISWERDFIKYVFEFWLGARFNHVGFRHQGNYHKQLWHWLSFANLFFFEKKMYACESVTFSFSVKKNVCMWERYIFILCKKKCIHVRALLFHSL